MGRAPRFGGGAVTGSETSRARGADRAVRVAERAGSEVERDTMTMHREREERRALSKVRTEPPERQVERKTQGRDRGADGSGARSELVRTRGSDAPLVRVRPVPQDRGDVDRTPVVPRQPIFPLKLERCQDWRGAELRLRTGIWELRGPAEFFCRVLWQKVPKKIGHPNLSSEVLGPSGETCATAGGGNDQAGISHGKLRRGCRAWALNALGGVVHQKANRTRPRRRIEAKGSAC